MPFAPIVAVPPRGHLERRRIVVLGIGGEATEQVDGRAVVGEGGVERVGFELGEWRHSHRRRFLQSRPSRREGRTLRGPNVSIRF